MKTKPIYQKLLKFVETIFLVWVFLGVAKEFGYNFGLRLNILFWLIFYLFLIYLFLETIENFSFIFSLVIRSFIWAKSHYLSKVHEIEKSGFFAKMARYFGEGIVFSLVFILTLFVIIWSLLARYIFKRKSLLIFCFLGIIFDIFWIRSFSDYVVFLIVSAWILAIRRCKFTGKISIIGSFVLFLFCLFLLIIKENNYAGKASTWVFMFLLVGVAQEMMASLKTGNSKVS